MKKIITAAALISAFVAAPAIAAAGDVYAGLDYSTVKMTNLGAGETQPDGGFRIMGGYKFSPTLAAEVGFSLYGSGTDADGTSTTPKSTTIAAVYSHPINAMFTAIGKLGYAMNSLDPGCTVCSKSGLMYGIGGQYTVNKQIGIRLQYEALGDFTDGPVDPQVGGSTINLGAIYNF